MPSATYASQPTCYRAFIPASLLTDPPLDLGQVMLLDLVQKGQRIGRDEHRLLKSSGLVEGPIRT